MFKLILKGFKITTSEAPKNHKFSFKRHQQLEKIARRIIYRFEDQRLSYADALTLAILQSYPEISAIFSFDRHMTLAGIPILPGIVNGIIHPETYIQEVDSC